MEGLIVESGPQHGLIVEIAEEGATVIGRTESCHVRVDDEKVSREHAAVVRKGRRLVLRDLQSRNGTILDGHFVRERSLNPGDVFRVGETRIRYSDSITEEDRALAMLGALPPTGRSVRDVQVVYDQGQWSKFTYACFACVLLGVHWLFALFALGLGVAAIVDIKRRGDLLGMRPTVIGLLVALGLCGYHGHRRVWTPMMETLSEHRAAQQCRKNMRTIYRALSRYLIDHPEGYPPDLSHLLPRYVEDPSYFCCPRARDPETLSKGHSTSYVYFGHTASPSEPRSILLVDHHPLNHAGKGRYVLYVDGAIIFVPEAAVARLLETAEAQTRPQDTP